MTGSLRTDVMYEAALFWTLATLGIGSYAMSIGNGTDANGTSCPPGYACFVWEGPIGIDDAHRPDDVPSIIVTLLFIAGCVGGSVAVSMVANAVYNRYTALPKVAAQLEEDAYDDTLIKQTLLTRVGVMSWKPDPAQPEEKFAKRAALTWLRKAAKIHHAGDDPQVEVKGAVANASDSEALNYPPLRAGAVENAAFTAEGPDVAAVVSVAAADSK